MTISRRVALLRELGLELTLLPNGRINAHGPRRILHAAEAILIQHRDELLAYLQNEQVQ